MGRVIVLAAALATAAALAPTTHALRSPACGHRSIPVEADPRGLLPLQPDSIDKAAAAALAYEDPHGKPFLVSSVLATADPDRGAIAKRECGTLVWSRTVVVSIRLRAFAYSASLSERVSFVGRFQGGYRVWQIVH